MDTSTPSGLTGFLKRYDLSMSQLAAMCKGSKGPLSRPSLIRLAKNEASPELVAQMQPELSKRLTDYLLGFAYSKEQIQAELELIFKPKTQEAEMICSRTTLPAEICRYFGLRRDPFTADPRSKEETFTTKQLDAITEQVMDAINYQGFMVVTGEIGSGKSVLKRRVMDAVEKSNGRMRVVWPEFFEMSRVRASSIVAALLDSFEQTVPQDLVRRRNKLERVLHDYADQDTRIAIGFDECHHLNDATLTALKNFWELGTGGYTRYLGVILFGQPAFEARLRDHKFREIVERVEVVQMPSVEKTAWDYVQHRVKAVGGEAEKLFEPAAVKALAAQARTPLALGNMANMALIKTYQLSEKKVQAAFVKQSDGDVRVRAVRASA